MNKIDKRSINETRINESRVFVENNEVKYILGEDSQKNGFMSIEDAKQITLAVIEKEYLLP